VDPGALAGASGFHTVMKDDNVSERTAALLYKALDVLQRVENAPDSPVNTFVPGKGRRLLRRGAERLRRGEAQPKYKNLFNAEQLADIYEKTILRDETREQTVEEFTRIGLEFASAIEEDGPAVQKTIEAIYLETLRAARENGPDSEAAQRLRQVRSLVRIAKQSRVDRRRQKPSRPFVPTYSHEGRIPLIPAEFLDSVPEGEAVIAIPPEGSGSGRPRILMRIGIGEASWIGSFEAGSDSFNTVVLLPDGKQLFVSADGAGYIIDLQSRTLVEQIGTEVAGLMADKLRTLFVVVHGGRRLEAFGRDGLLWKTEAIGSERIRHMDMADTTIVGEGVHPLLRGWTNFTVELATGKVRFHPR